MNKRTPAPTEHTFEVHRWSVPLLPFILHTDVHRSGENDLGNWHDSLELLLVVSGHGTLYAGGGRHTMDAGTVLVIQPGDVHRIETDSEVTYHCLIVGDTFCTENGIEASRAVYDSCCHDEELNTLFLEVMQHMQDEDDPYRTVATRLSVLRLLLYLCRHHAIPVEQHKTAEATDPVRAGLDYIHCHFQEPLQVDRIAKHARVSKYHFLRLFKQYTGYTVVSYLRLLRCRRAAELLIGTGERITVIAKQCGFDSPAYFAKIFHAVMGMRPAEYRTHHANMREQDRARTE